MSGPTFAALLRRWREGADLNQAGLADRADLGPNQISRYEHGVQTPGIGNAERLIQALAADPIRRDRMRLAAWRALAGDDAEEDER